MQASCFNCKKSGYKVKDCPTVICNACRGWEHIIINCLKKNECYICESITHVWKYCSKWKICWICKKSGHMMINCSEKEIHAIKNIEWTRKEYKENRNNLCECEKCHVIES